MVLSQPGKFTWLCLQINLQLLPTALFGYGVLAELVYRKLR
jgi:hypothetical protein